MTRTSGSTGFLALLGLGALSLSGAGLSLSCTDESCALNGKCSSSTARCTCSPGWSGATCEQLAVQPAQPLPQGYGVSPNLTSWGGSVVAYGGEFHMFVSEIIQSCEEISTSTSRSPRRMPLRLCKQRGRYSTGGCHWLVLRGRSALLLMSYGLQRQVCPWRL